MSRTRILLVDDHAIVLEGLKALLAHRFDLVGTAENGWELIEKAQRLQPDVIVLDISMPQLNGIDAARRLKEQNSTAKIVFLTMHSDSRLVKEAFRVGASGYVLKRAASAELVGAIREVMEGRYYVTPLITKDVVNSFLAPAQQSEREPVNLTERQREVLKLVAEGRSLKEIASALGVSSKTIEYHKRSIMDVLGLRTTAELTRYAIKHGISSL